MPPAGASKSAMTSAVGSIPQPGQDAVEGGSHDSRHDWIVRLIKSDGRGILRLLWRLLGSEPDVMDAYQDCFCKLAARGGGRDLSSARAYAYRTATNIAIEMIRARRRRQAHWPAIVREHTHERTEPPGPLAERPESPERPERCEPLREAIAQLSPHLRNVIVLRDLSRLSYAEVGRTLGIEPATARVYRRHAVVKLAELLGEQGES